MDNAAVKEIVGFGAEEFGEEDTDISAELEAIVSAIAEEETLEECVAFEMIGEDN